MSPEMKKAKGLVEEAFELVGEDGLRVVIMDLGRAQLTIAISQLFSDAAWQSQFLGALQAPNHAQVALLCKAIDKFLPTPQTVRVLQDVPDSFIVQYEQPDESQGEE